MIMKEGYESMELMYAGHLACAGCGATISMRYALKALGDNTVIVLPACDCALSAWNAPSS